MAIDQELDRQILHLVGNKRAAHDKYCQLVILHWCHRPHNGENISSVMSLTSCHRSQHKD